MSPTACGSTVLGNQHIAIGVIELFDYIRPPYVFQRSDTLRNHDNLLLGNDSEARGRFIRYSFPESMTYYKN